MHRFENNAEIGQSGGFLALQVPSTADLAFSISRDSKTSIRISG